MRETVIYSYLITSEWLYFAATCSAVTNSPFDDVLSGSAPSKQIRTFEGIVAYLHCWTLTRIPIWVRISIPKMGTVANWGSGSESESEFMQWEQFLYSTMNPNPSLCPAM